MAGSSWVEPPATSTDYHCLSSECVANLVADLVDLIAGFIRGVVNLVAGLIGRFADLVAGFIGGIFGARADFVAETFFTTDGAPGLAAAPGVAALAVSCGGGGGGALQSLNLARISVLGSKPAPTTSLG